MRHHLRGICDLQAMPYGVLDDQEFLFLMSLESLWHLLLVRKGVTEIIGRFVTDDTFFPLFSLFSP